MGDWNWVYLGGAITSDPAAAFNDDGTVEVFVRGTDNALYHNWNNSWTGHPSDWSGWESLGGILTSNISVVKNAYHGLEAFVRGNDNHLYHIAQSKQHGNWSGWESLVGGILYNPVAVFSYDSFFSPVVFARGIDGALNALYPSASDSPTPTPPPPPTPPPTPNPVDIIMWNSASSDKTKYTGSVISPPAGAKVTGVKNDSIINNVLVDYNLTHQDGNQNVKKDVAMTDSNITYTDFNGLGLDGTWEATRTSLSNTTSLTVKVYWK